MTVRSTKIGKKRLSHEFITKHLRGFYRAPDKVTFTKYCATHNAKALNLGKIFRASGLSKMKANKVDASVAVEMLKTFLGERNERNNEKMKNLHTNN